MSLKHNKNDFGSELCSHADPERIFVTPDNNNKHKKLTQYKDVQKINILMIGKRSVCMSNQIKIYDI